MARRRANPFAELKRALPRRAFLEREEPLRKADKEELDEACKTIAGGAAFLRYAGSRDDENGCKVICFDTPEKAQAMRAWIKASAIEQRPRPEPAPDFGVLRCG